MTGQAALGYPGQARLLTQRQVDAWKPVVEDIQAAGALAVMQMFHCGKIFNRATAEDALKDADIVLSSKSLLLNPDWVDDLRKNKDLPFYSSEDANIACTRQPLP